MRRSRGFTLIELLVVMAILALLAAALLPPIGDSYAAATSSACQLNLRKIYHHLTRYRTKRGRFPTKPGAKFLLSIWTDGVCHHTEPNRDMFFCPAVEDPLVIDEIKKTPIDDLWPRLDDITSTDTHYAGRNTADRSLSRRLLNDRECLVADDNEDGSNHRDHVNCLMGGGQVKTIERLDLVQGDVITKDVETIPVGDGSPVGILRQVRKD